MCWVVGGGWCVVCGVWCVVCGVWCVVCGVRCVVRGVWRVVCVAWCVLCVVCCVLCGVWCVVFVECFVLCGVWCVVCGVWCVVCGVWCVVCGEECTCLSFPLARDDALGSKTCGQPSLSRPPLQAPRNSTTFLAHPTSRFLLPRSTSTCSPEERRGGRGEGRGEREERGEGRGKTGERREERGERRELSPSSADRTRTPCQVYLRLRIKCSLSSTSKVDYRHENKQFWRVKPKVVTISRR